MFISELCTEIIDPTEKVCLALMHKICACNLKAEKWHILGVGEMKNGLRVTATLGKQSVIIYKVS